MKLRQNLFDRRYLLLGSLPYDLDAQFGGTYVDDVRVAARDQSKLAAGALPQPNAESVLDIEPLNLDSFVCEDDAAVGQHAVDVGKYQFNRLTKAGNRHVQLRLSGEASSKSENGPEVIIRLKIARIGFNAGHRG